MSTTLELAKQLISQASVTPEDAQCQKILSDFLKPEGFNAEVLMFEDVTNLVVDSDGMKISTLFEGPKAVKHVAISSIDFTAGKVFLQPTG